MSALRRELPIAQAPEKPTASREHVAVVSPAPLPLIRGTCGRQRRAPPSSSFRFYGCSSALMRGWCH